MVRESGGEHRMGVKRAALLDKDGCMRHTCRATANILVRQLSGEVMVLVKAQTALILRRTSERPACRQTQ